MFRLTIPAVLLAVLLSTTAAGSPATSARNRGVGEECSYRDLGRGAAGLLFTIVGERLVAVALLECI
jgi:hypothetical protein